MHPYSLPITPAPIAAIVLGTCRRFGIVSEVKIFPALRENVFGTRGDDPVAMKMFFPRRSRGSGPARSPSLAGRGLTLTVCGSTRVAFPLKTSVRADSIPV